VQITELKLYILESGEATRAAGGSPAVLVSCMLGLGLTPSARCPVLVRLAYARPEAR
jgi:hypothetical protein